MGFGLPAALGASIAAPDRHVVAIIGDGSLLSVLSELETARAAGGPVTVVLLDDNAYGLLEFRISADLAARTCQFPGPDWSRLGDAFGFTTADVKVDQLSGELAARPPGFRVLRVDATPIGNDWRRS
jgi:thiamine pyrophosphate-dependent acetolactate synthase large subunit-like protein